MEASSLGPDALAVQVAIAVDEHGTPSTVGMAALLTPEYAVTTGHVVQSFRGDRPPGSTLLLLPVLGTGSGAHPVVVSAFDPQADVALLELLEPGSAAVPAFPLGGEIPEGARWELWFTSPALPTPTQVMGETGPALMFEGEPRVRLRPGITVPSWDGISGTPVFLEGGRLIGLVWGSFGEQELLLLPWERIAKSRAVRESLGAPEFTGPAEAEPLDLESFMSRVGAGARAVLERAEGIAHASHPLHQVHMEHLLWACYRSREGTLARLARRAGLDEDALAGLLEEAAGARLARDAGPLADATSPPDLSPHVADALREARDAADRHGVRVITSPYLAYGALSVRRCDVVQALRAAGIRRADVELVTPPRAGYRSDEAGGPDLLGIGREVDALASVLASHDVDPPLSLGLFGDWGTGKSFFMQALQERIDDIAAAAGEAEGQSTYCANVVQIRFNAWHFIDSADLWAGLTAEVFARLADELDRQKVPPVTRERLLVAASSTRDALARAQANRDVLQAEVVRAGDEIARLGERRDEIRRELAPETLFRAAVKFVAERDDVKATLEAKAQELELDQAKAAVAEVRESALELGKAGRRARALWLSLRNPADRRVWALFAAGVAVAVLVVALVDRLDLTGIGAWVTGAAGVIAGLATALQPVLKQARRWLDLLESARAEQTRVAEEEAKRLRAPLEAERDRVAKKLEIAQTEVAETEKALRAVEEQIDELRADRRMADFIRERSLSTDYTQHLGTIARVRRDFDKLSRLLLDAREQREKRQKELAAARAQQNVAPPAGEAEAEEEAFPQVDRIILYVDDLDRCPEDRVVQVLQAVHLLLAFRLFVVVVAVDSRWLLHSLRQHSRAFQPDAGEGLTDEERLHWRSTPLNYLEKIFQIPFNLRPMRHTGFDDLIDSLARAPSDGAPRGSVTISLGAEDGESAELASGLLKAVVEEVEKSGPLVGGQAPADGGEAEKRREIDVNPESLQIKDWERAAMKRLFPLIPSPRAAKRFVNVYRLVRAMVDDAERDHFVGTAEWGPHRCALLLLALLTGHPVEATEILRALLDAPPAQPWADFIEKYRPVPEEDGAVADVEDEAVGEEEEVAEDEAVAAAAGNGAPAVANGEPDEEELRWDRVFDRLDRVGDDFIPEWVTCAAFREWAPQVARFSFHSGRVVIDYHEQPA